MNNRPSQKHGAKPNAEAHTKRRSPSDLLTETFKTKVLNPEVADVSETVDSPISTSSSRPHRAFFAMPGSQRHVYHARHSQPDEVREEVGILQEGLPSLRGGNCKQHAPAAR